jgi:hypothetical protein
MKNLTNMVKSPNRITSHTKSLIDVIKVNNTNDDMLIKILDMGYSDHVAQFSFIKSKKLPKGPITTYTRYFTDHDVEEFKYLMHEETWNEVLEYNKPNTSFKLWNTYFAYFQSQLRYGIIFWGGARESKKILHIQKKEIRLLKGFKNVNLVNRNLKKIKFLL